KHPAGACAIGGRKRQEFFGRIRDSLLPGCAESVADKFAGRRAARAIEAKVELARQRIFASGNFIRATGEEGTGGVFREGEGFGSGLGVRESAVADRGFVGS